MLDFLQSIFMYLNQILLTCLTPIQWMFATLIETFLKFSGETVNLSLSGDNINTGLTYFLRIDSFGNILTFVSSIAILITILLTITHIGWDILINNNLDTEPIKLLFKCGFTCLFITMIPDIVFLIVNFGIDFASKIAGFGALSINDAIAAVSSSKSNVFNGGEATSWADLGNSIFYSIVTLFILGVICWTCLIFFYNICKRGVRLFLEIINLIITAPDLVYGGTSKFSASVMNLFSISLETGYDILMIQGFIMIVNNELIKIFGNSSSLSFDMPSVVMFIVLMFAWQWGTREGSKQLNARLTTLGGGAERGGNGLLNSTASSATSAYISSKFKK